MKRLVPVMLAILLSACSVERRVPPPASPPTQTGISSLPAPSPTPRLLPHRFRAAVSPIPAGLADRMTGTTWRPGCPVPLDELRFLSLRQWGFDGLVHQGPMVVNASVADDIVSVFRAIFLARFPIHELHLTHRYRGPKHDDPRDPRDFTASFNCRPAVTARGPLDNWSQHAYGLAIDINPVENPYVTEDGYIRSIPARPYRDRSVQRKGMVLPGSGVVRAFAAVGWEWGGDWSHDKDYMHFSLTGN